MVLQKAVTLRQIVRRYAEDGLVVAFSGGVDSTLLLRLAIEEAPARDRILAVTLSTPFHPPSELDDCRILAADMGAPFEAVILDQWPDATLMTNPTDRCYRCKRSLFERLLRLADERGLKHVVDGGHVDDTKEHRPGLRALRELGIKSPLTEAGFTKADTRTMARDLGITVADKPSTPCLATRLPYGTPLSAALFARIEKAEAILRSAGFPVNRVRVHGDIARLEIDPSLFEVVLQKRAAIIDALKPIGFKYLTLDLAGFRSGSMDETRDSGSDAAKRAH